MHSSKERYGKTVYFSHRQSEARKTRNVLGSSPPPPPHHIQKPRTLIQGSRSMEKTQLELRKETTCTGIIRGETSWHTESCLQTTGEKPCRTWVKYDITRMWNITYAWCVVDKKTFLVCRATRSKHFLVHSVSCLCCTSTCCCHTYIPCGFQLLAGSFPSHKQFSMGIHFFAGLQFELSFRFIDSWTVLEIFIWAFGPCLFFTHLDFVHDNTGNEFVFHGTCKYLIYTYLQVLDLHMFNLASLCRNCVWNYSMFYENCHSSYFPGESWRRVAMEGFPVVPGATAAQWRLYNKQR